MTLPAAVLAGMTISGVAAIGDPPAAPAALAPAAPASDAPATAAPLPPAVAASAEPKAILGDKELRDMGYKPQIVEGTRLWCRDSSPPLGTRLVRGAQSCYTAVAIKEQLKNGREITDRAQTNNQNGPPPGSTR